METIVKVTVNGKEFKKLEDAFNQIYYDSMIVQVYEIVAPFENEIITQGGGVQVNFVDKGPDVVPQMDVSIDRISEELIARIDKHAASVKRKYV